jgi:hypothetical protein
MPYAFFNTKDPVVKYSSKGKWWGETEEGVIACIEMAHRNKLTVMLKPHLWIDRGLYTGAFTLTTEREWQLWEESYRKYILTFALIADSMNVGLFCIGTELGTAIKERPSFWSALIDTVKQVYSGKLTYAANWDDYKRFPLWKKLDYIGVDAYFPLAKEETPQVVSILNEWKKYSDELQKLSEENNRPVLFTEYGYRNVSYTTKEPWKENEGDRNDKAQANAYEALYKSFSGKKWFSGGYLWKWDVDTSWHRKRIIDFTPQEKEALNTIKTFYKSK